MDGASAELAAGEPKISEEPPSDGGGGGGGGGVAELTPEELVAKSIAPVKREFLRPPPTRTCRDDADDVDSKTKKSALSSSFLKEKKSKRQLKRERQQEKKSALHLCPVVARSGDVSSCRYNDKCHFSHDVEAFKAEKPDDLEGECPFVSAEGLARMVVLKWPVTQIIKRISNCQRKLLLTRRHSSEELFDILEDRET